MKPAEDQPRDPRPFKIQVFVAEGRPDGLRLVEKSNWIGLGIVCPRGSYPNVKQRNEFSRSGVYILVGPSGDTEGPQVYVGEGETVRTRLDEHYASKDFWQQAIVFTTSGTPRNKAEVRYLEAKLLKLARRYGRCRVENRTDPEPSGLREADQAEMDGYLEEVLSLLPVLGIDAFEPAETVSPEQQHLYQLQTKHCDATGFETRVGFTVMKDSHARATPTPSLRKHFPLYDRKRKHLIEEGILNKETDGYRFGRDYRFGSPSEAAAVCAGTPLNGLDAWKDSGGSSIKENRMRATSDTSP